MSLFKGLLILTLRRKDYLIKRECPDSLTKGPLITEIVFCFFEVVLQ